MSAKNTSQIHRDRTEAVLADLEKKMVFIVGPRQVGKTWLTRQIGERFNRTEYLNYDNSKDRETIRGQEWARNADLLILDELHKMKDWKNFLKGVYDTKPEGMRMLVTGSARLETYRRMGDSLAGRYFAHHLMPFSLSELEKQGVDTEYASIDRLLMRGGFPEPFLAVDAVDADRWRTSYIDSLTRTDVFDIENIHNMRAMVDVFELLRYKTGSVVSYTGIARDIGVSPTTVKKYVEVLEALYIIFLVKPYTHKIARAILKEPKVYFYDTGLVKGGDGVRFENLVAVSLLKHQVARNDLKGERNRLAYVRSKSDKEIDFVLVNSENEPELLVEAKQSETHVAPNLVYFAEKYAVHGVQVVQYLDHERQATATVEVRDARGFLSTLS
ncbi:MAG: ATP-binding protein [Candidatus Pacebacteria bacterium]|nr:ATP-binding protein [Candidatus Paceibacterota bacterium]